MKSTFFGCIALLCTINTVQAAPVTITTAQGQGADTSVRGGELSSRAFGALDILRIRNSANAISTRKAYVRFDLSTTPSPIESAKSATLNLTIGTAEGASPADKTWTFQVFGLKDGVTGEDWNEKTANWDNAPANNPKGPTAFNEDALPLGTFTIVGKGEAAKTASFSSPELLSFLQSDTNGKVSLLMTRSEAGDTATDNVVHIFAAKENKTLTAPSLVLNFE